MRGQPQFTPPLRSAVLHLRAAAALRAAAPCRAASRLPRATQHMASRCCVGADCASPDVEACAPAAWAEAHGAAVRRRAATYTDPATGYSVFTEAGLLAQGVCCGSGCRHCPFGHQHVPAAARRRGQLPPAAVLLRAAPRARGRAGALPPARPADDAPPRTGVLWTVGGGGEQSGAAAVAVLLFDAATGALLGAPPDGACPPLHLHAAIDALLATSTDGAAVPLRRGAAGGSSLAQQTADALQALRVTAPDALAAAAALDAAALHA